MNLFAQNSYGLEYAKTHFIELVLFAAAFYLLYRILSLKYSHGKKLPPGPIGLPFVGYLPFLGPEPHKTLARMRKKYGDIIGLKIGAQYVVVLNEYNVLKETLSHPASFDRPIGFFDDLKLGFGANNGELWREQRRYVMQVMRNLGFGRGPWDTLVKNSAADFVQQLRLHKGQPIDIHAELQRNLANNITSLLFGRKLQPEEDKDKIRTLAKFSHLGALLFGPVTPSSLIPGFKKICEYLNISIYKETASVTKDFLDIMNSEIEKHWRQEDYQNLEDYTNMYKAKLQQMQEQQNGTHFFNDDNLLGNATSLFIGSSDTSTSSIGFLFRLMAGHLDIQQKVHKELDEVIGRDGSVMYDERYKVPYTFAVLLESQRWASIVPLTTSRRAIEEFEIRGFVIPKGAFITGNTWQIHHDPDYWKEPDVFQPERFLTQNGELVKNPQSFAPFSVGKRNCIGETVAWMVLLSVFTVVMQKFQILPPPGQKLRFDTYGGIVVHLKPQPLCFVERT